MEECSEYTNNYLVHINLRERSHSKTSTLLEKLSLVFNKKSLLSPILKADKTVINFQTIISSSLYLLNKPMIILKFFKLTKL